MNDPVMLRKYVREVMALAPNRKFSERMLFDAVNRLTAAPLQVDELKNALQWNQARDYASTHFDEDQNADVWELTPAGRQKEGFK